MLKSEGYHAHVYYVLEQIEQAQLLRQKMLVELPGVEGIGPTRRTAIGPHPVPMFEAWFKNDQLDPVLRWLMQNRSDFSVMIHPLSGDDLADHKNHSLWLGQVLKLNLDIFLAK